MRFDVVRGVLMMRVVYSCPERSTGEMSFLRAKVLAPQPVAPKIGGYP